MARASAACPDPVVAEGTVTRVALAAPGPLTGEDAGGAGRDGQVPAGPPWDRRRRGPRPWSGSVAPGSATEEAAAETGPLVARGSGRSAPGLVASQLTRSSEVAMRGLAGTTCATSGTDFWFVGSGAVVGQRGRVYLTNSEPAPAVVDVTLYGPDGPTRRAGRPGRHGGGREAAGPAAGRAGARHRTVRRARARPAGPDLGGRSRPAGRRAHPAGSRLGAASRRRPRPACWCPACPVAPGSGGCRSSHRGTRTASSGSGWSASPGRSRRPAWT